MMGTKLIFLSHYKNKNQRTNTNMNSYLHNENLSKMHIEM